MSSIDLDRRDFLKASGGTALAASVGSRSLVERGTAQEDAGESEGETSLVKTICAHCAVGCGLKMEVQNDSVVGQEAWEDHPINQGGLCAKGASLAETVNSETRLKEPMKKEGGTWTRISWDQALSEIGEELSEIRETDGPDSVFWMGSAKVNNEEAYLFRKLAGFYGTNNVDHQARICHSTTVAGLANTWGFGAQTNTINDFQHQDATLIIGHNPAETHPVMMRYVKQAQRNGGTVVVAEPRFTKTAAAADDYVRFRPGTDVPFIYGMLHHIVFELDAHDEQFLADRVYGWDTVKETLREYDPETAADITWVDADTIRSVAKTLADADTSTVDWSMGSTQHTNGTQNIRAYAILNLALGHAAQPGGGANPLRGHDNVQGATDVCILSHSLPGYYGLSEGAWTHWARVWDQTPSTSGSTSYDDMHSRFDSTELMERPGLTVARWFEGALSDADRKGDLYQPNPLRAAVIWGHSLNSVSEMKREKQALEELDLIVGVDPYPALTSSLPDRDDGIYLLPAATQMETEGSVTNSNRSIQWRSQAVTPRHNARTDLEIIQGLANELGFGDHFDYDSVEDVTREWNLGMRTIGMIGQTPERMKAHMEHSNVFRTDDLKAEVTEDNPLAGDYFGMPWPCWHDEHPGTPILYDAGKHPAKGGLDFRARWGTEAPDGNPLLRNDYDPDWWDDTIEGVPQYPLWHKVLPDPSTPAAKTTPIEYAERADRSVSDAASALADEGYDVDPGDYSQFDAKQPDPPTGRGRARARAWNLADDVPVHREPVETPRPDLIDEYPNYGPVENHYRLDLDNRALQEARRDLAEQLPLVLTTGRQVEHTGGGAETRNNAYTAERAPMMYAELNPKLANEYDLGTGDWLWVTTQRGKMLVQARVTERTNEHEVFLPFHWGGLFEGEDYTERYPPGLKPTAIGDSANIGTSDGYDIETQMQETKVALCNIQPADPSEIPDLPDIQQAYQEQLGFAGSSGGD